MDLQNEKPWYQSKGVWGSVMVMASSLAAYLGYDIGGPDANAEAITALVGGVLAFYGRVKAVKKLK